MAKLSGWSYISQLGLMKPLDINKHGNFVHIYNILSLSLSLSLRDVSIVSACKTSKC